MPFNSLDAELTTIREQRIFFQSYGELLVARFYAAPDELFANWLPAFHTLINTFAHMAHSKRETVYAITDLPAAMPLRETPPEYDNDDDVEDSA